MQVDSTSIIVAAMDHPTATVGDETVILASASGRYFGVNAVGARIWELIQLPTSVAAIRDAIVSEYEVEPQRCEADVLGLMREMQQARMINVN